MPWWVAVAMLSLPPLAQLLPSGALSISQPQRVQDLPSKEYGSALLIVNLADLNVLFGA